MSEELISKKDLLDQTGISYGQLYRWKRKDLIPEEWFIRKSTFTGQETFFPKEKILDRIDKIQKYKENLSLDELANMFSPNVKELSLTMEEIIKHGLVTKSTVQLYMENTSISTKELSFEHILTIYLIEQLLVSGEINLDEARMALQVIEDYVGKNKQLYGELYMIRKLGISTCFILVNGTEVLFEKGTKVVVHLHFSTYIEELRTKLM